jgi:hypothetical protein
VQIDKQAGNVSSTAIGSVPKSMLGVWLRACNELPWKHKVKMAVRVTTRAIRSLLECRL